MFLKSTRLAFYTVGLLLLSRAMSELVIYRLLVVPRLDEWTSIPFVWWITICAPVLFAMIFISSRISSMLDVVLVSAASAILHQLYEFVAVNLGQPGHLKSFAIEDPLYFWTVTSALIVLAHIAWYSLLWFCFHLLRKKGIISQRSSAETGET
jgi:hypothetical protein